MKSFALNSSVLETFRLRRKRKRGDLVGYRTFWLLLQANQPTHKSLKPQEPHSFVPFLFILGTELVLTTLAPTLLNLWLSFQSKILLACIFNVFYLFKRSRHFLLASLVSFLLFIVVNWFVQIVEELTLNCNINSMELYLQEEMGFPSLHLIKSLSLQYLLDHITVQLVLDHLIEFCHWIPTPDIHQCLKML